MSPSQEAATYTKHNTRDDHLYISELRSPDFRDRRPADLRFRPYVHRSRKTPQFAAQNTHEHAKGVNRKLSTLWAHSLKKLRQARSVMFIFKMNSLLGVSCKDIFNVYDISVFRDLR